MSSHFVWDPIFGVYVLMASFVLGMACLLAWGVRTGAMKDDESPKFRMLEDDGGDHDGEA